MTIQLYTNPTNLLNKSRFLNLFIKRVNYVDLFIILYLKEKNTNFRINQIDLNYEKPNK